MLNHGTILATGTTGGAIVLNDGLVENAAGGFIGGSIGIILSGTGTIVNAGTIATSQPAGTAIIMGTGTGNLLVIDPGSTLIGAIAEFAAGDAIDFANASLSGESFTDGMLVLSNSSGPAATLSLTGAFDSSEFTLSSDGATGTRITLGLDVITSGITNGKMLTAPSTSIAAGVTVSGPANGVYGGNDAWSLTDSGTIIGGDAVVDAGISLVNAAVIRIEAGALVEGYAGVRLGAGTLIDAGTIASTAVNNGNAIYLLPTTNDVALVLDPGASLIGAIKGFVAGDRIDLAQLNITGESFGNGVLTLSDNGVDLAALTLAGGFTTAEFGLTPDGAGGTEVTLNARDTIKGIYSTGIALSALYTTITALTQINTNGTAVSGAYGRDWTLVNSGEIQTGIQGFGDQGVNLSDGELTNKGLIRGYTGVVLSGGQFTNDATVQGLGHYGYGFIDLGTNVGFSNAKSGVIAGGLGVRLQNATGQNAGQIIAYNPRVGTGVNLTGITTFSNTGQITAATGIALGSGSSASNSGTVIATTGNYYGAQDSVHVGLRMGGGNFSNLTHGVIEGPTGATITGGTLVNAGDILGVPGGYYIAGYGVSHPFASEGAVITNGSVTNKATGLISGNTGVLLQGGILTNAGTIASTATSGATIAVEFGTHAATLILDPGAAVLGAVESFGSGDVIELAHIGTGATLTSSTDMAGDILVTIAGGSTEPSAWDLTFAASSDFALVQIAGGAELLGDTSVISNGQTAAGGTIGAGFDLLVLSGGVDTGSTILAGGSETVFAGGTVVISASVTSGLTLAKGSTEVIGSGVTFTGVTVASGVTLTVEGTADGTVVNSGGKMVVASGGVASGITLSTGGKETVLAGGKTYITAASTPGLTLNRGSTEIIADGVEIDGAKISAGLNLDVWGTANDAKVSSGGMAFVFAEGMLLDGKVLSGGMLSVYFGAFVRGNLAISGGTALVYGTVIPGTDATFAGPGGSLQLGNPAFAGAIQGFGAGDTIDLLTVPFGGVSSYTFAEAKNNKSGVLTVSGGGQQMKLTLDGNYTSGIFTVSSGAMGGSLVAFTSSGTGV